MPGQGGRAMTEKPVDYCLRCAALRSVTDCRQGKDELVIELEPCNHVILRSACLEWVVERTDATLVLINAG